MDYDVLWSVGQDGRISMNEEIKVHPIKSFKDYGLAKRNFEELTKKISLMKLDLELDDEETPKLESGIVEMEQKLEEQKKYY
mgnify:CR=1 FL=1